MARNKDGDYNSFDENWNIRAEAHYNHWSQGEPNNQIQLAFKSHYQVLKELMADNNFKGGKLLETGCGRGTLSSYFSEDGWDVTLLDFSKKVLSIAAEIFKKNQLRGYFVEGDANNLPFEDHTFDVVTNIGLLEHFENISHVMSEQLRVTKPGGWCLSYIVPERPDNIQRYFHWFNFILRTVKKSQKNSDSKPEIYRSDNFSQQYIDALDHSQVDKVVTFGMYPLPMISHNVSFPFSLNSDFFERKLVKLFKISLKFRSRIYNRNGWICDERNGQAFLFAYRKSKTYK